MALGVVRHLRRPDGEDLRRAARLTFAAVASYLAALAFLPGQDPSLAPLTALLVVQFTLYRTLLSGVERVVSVVSGVLLAVLFAAVVGETWWSLGALIALSIVIGQVLRLGPNLLEVPISAMLVLGVNGTGAAATQRIGETVIGAVVGVVVNVLVPPAVRLQDAGWAVETFADRVARLLDDVAGAVLTGVGEDRAAQWIAEARRLNRLVWRLDRQVREAEDSRKLNLRAIHQPEAGPELRDGLETLERTTVALRGLFRSMGDAAARHRLEPDPGHLTEVRAAFALLMRDIACAVRSFGGLVHAEAAAQPVHEELELASSLAALQDAESLVSDLLLRGPAQDPQGWDLNVAVLSTARRVLRELDLERHRTCKRHRHRSAVPVHRPRRPARRPAGPVLPARRHARA